MTILGLRGTAIDILPMIWGIALTITVTNKEGQFGGSSMTLSPKAARKLARTLLEEADRMEENQ